MIVMNAKLHFTDWLFEDNVLFGCDGCLDNLSERDDLSENVVRKMCYILDPLTSRLYWTGKSASTTSTFGSLIKSFGSL